MKNICRNGRYTPRDCISIVAINKKRLEIETAFRVMKSEFKARSVYVRKEHRIKAHFLTCYLALLVLRTLEKKLSNKYTTKEIISTLKVHSMRKIKGLAIYQHLKGLSLQISCMKYQAS